jgi:hypothetical protein
MNPIKNLSNILMEIRNIMKVKTLFLFNMFKNKCVICNRKVSPLRKYINDKGEEVKVCIPCSEYAERRAFRKVK